MFEISFDLARVAKINTSSRSRVMVKNPKKKREENKGEGRKKEEENKTKRNEEKRRA